APGNPLPSSGLETQQGRPPRRRPSPSLPPTIMSSHSSRSTRPEIPPPLALTARDRQILSAVFQHRYLTAEHVHRLLFPRTDLRRAQERLRRLWCHHFLDRHFVPYVLDGEHPAPYLSGRPLY